jgi:hypothetical protein
MLGLGGFCTLLLCCGTKGQVRRVPPRVSLFKGQGFQTISRVLCCCSSIQERPPWGGGHPVLGRQTTAQGCEQGLWSAVGYVKCLGEPSSTVVSNVTEYDKICRCVCVCFMLSCFHAFPTPFFLSAQHEGPVNAPPIWRGGHMYDVWYSR